MTPMMTMIQHAPSAPIPLPGFNPFGPLGSAAGKVVADGWTAAMLAIWNAGMWLLRLALHFIDVFMTPDLAEDGPGRPIYELSLWVGVTLFVVMSSVQLATAAFQRNGKGLARVLIGYGQFVMIWATFITYALALITGVQGLSGAILSETLHVKSWAEFDPLGTKLDAKDVTEGATATILGALGVVLIFAALGHILVMIARSASMMVILGTSSISASGLGSDLGKSWFWKCFRWFHAAALTPVLMALVLGLGVTFTKGVATGMNDGVDKAIGTAVPGVLLVLVAAFVPLALFKLLAFTDPNTNSGAAMRAGLAASGGVSGLLGAGGKGSETSGAASSVDNNGKSQAESNGQSDSSGRVASGLKKLGPIGSMLGSTVGAAGSMAAKSASLGADLTNQMGVGHGQYVPDFGGSRGGPSSSRPGQRGDGEDAGGDDEESSPEGGPDAPQPPQPPGAPEPPNPPGQEQGPPAPTGQGQPTPPEPPNPQGPGQGGQAPNGDPGGKPPATPGGAGGAGGSGGAAGGGAAATPPPVV